MEQQIRPVNQILYDALNNRIENNRAKLKPIIKTVVFCGRQNIPLRGHHDDSTYYDHENPGNFQALLDFRVNNGNKVLQEHFKTANRNATYRSKPSKTRSLIAVVTVSLKKLLARLKNQNFCNYGR